MYQQALIDALKVALGNSALPLSVAGTSGIVSSLGYFENLRAADVQGDYAYVTYKYGMFVVDISDKAFPTVVATLELQTSPVPYCLDIVVDGNYAYISSTSVGGIWIVDITNPLAPVLSARLTHASLTGTHGLAKAGNYVYACVYTGQRFTIVDVTNPAAPVVAGSLLDAINLNGPHDVEVSGNYAYVTCHFSETTGQGRFTIMNVANPAAPVVAGSVKSTKLSYAADVVLRLPYAYCGRYTGNGAVGLLTLSVNNPAAPTILNLIGQAGMYIGCMEETNKLMYAEDHGRRIYVLDMVNLTPLRYLKTLYVPQNHYGIIHITLTDDNNYLFVCDSAGGVGRIYLVDVHADQVFSRTRPSEKVAKDMLILPSLAAGATSVLGDCGEIRLDPGNTLALTVEATYNAAASNGIKVHIRTSFDVDNVNYDSEDWDSWEPAFTAGGTVLQTKNYDTDPLLLKVLIENLDPAQAVTNITVTAIVGNTL